MLMSGPYRDKACPPVCSGYTIRCSLFGSVTGRLFKHRRDTAMPAPILHALLLLAATPALHGTPVQLDRKQCIESVEDSPAALVSCLTDRRWYEMLTRPPAEERPLRVQAKIFIYHLKTSARKNMKFSVQLLLQLKWRDQRLSYEAQNTNVKVLMGEKGLMQSIWTPHIFLSNDSLVMGPLRKDDLITVLPDGIVFFTTRLKTSITCNMELGNFPFDKQRCQLIFDSWRYNSKDLVLEWDKHSPAVMKEDDVNLSEFFLMNMEVQTAENNFSSIGSGEAYNYSSLVLIFSLGREYGFYLMDYYVPSILLVILSWMSFWLAADQVPPRVLLGTSTMLTFIQLAWSDSSLPKVSQLKSNDVWAVGCTSFIFLSLTEFAFVNTIDRRDKEHKVELKKPTSKYILRSTLSSTKPPRMRMRRSSSCPSSPEIRRHFAKNIVRPRHRTVQELSGRELARGVKAALKEIKEKEETTATVSERPSGSGGPPGEHSSAAHKPATTGHIMTPQEIAMWIDNKSRLVFPLAFLIFNICYWSFLWI